MTDPRWKSYISELRHNKNNEDISPSKCLVNPKINNKNIRQVSHASLFKHGRSKKSSQNTKKTITGGPPPYFKGPNKNPHPNFRCSKNFHQKPQDDLRGWPAQRPFGVARRGRFFFTPWLWCPCGRKAQRPPRESGRIPTGKPKTGWFVKKRWITKHLFKGCDVNAEIFEKNL